MGDIPDHVAEPLQQLVRQVWKSIDKFERAIQVLREQGRLVKSEEEALRRFARGSWTLQSREGNDTWTEQALYMFDPFAYIAINLTRESNGIAALTVEYQVPAVRADGRTFLFAQATIFASNPSTVIWSSSEDTGFRMRQRDKFENPVTALLQFGEASEQTS